MSMRNIPQTPSVESRARRLIGTAPAMMGKTAGRTNSEEAPLGWTRTAISEFAPLQRGFDLPNLQLRPGPYPVVYSNGVLHKHKKAMVKGPGVVTGRSGTIGSVHFVEKNYWPHNTTLWVTSFCGNDPKFVYYLYSHIDLARFLSGSSVPTLNRNDVHHHLVLRPPVREQRAIAEALLDVDGLLESLDALIAKKQSIKQATMQRLLTGNTRLPGFSGAWETKAIGDFAQCIAGGTPSTGVPEYWDGAIRWMSSGELNKKLVKDVEGRITEKGLRESSAMVVPPRCILVGLAGQGKTRGTVAMNLVDLCTNQSIAAILPNGSFVPEYLYFNLDSRYDELRGLSTGDGGRGGLNLRIIRSINIPFPDIREQRAIAAVLSGMASEIAALEQRRDKARVIKKGMMQQLLTGQVRLT